MDLSGTLHCIFENYGSHTFSSYVSASEAGSLAIAGTTRSGDAYMGVDYKTTLNSGGPGRKSVRISSKKSWTHGLFIADIKHMPGGICGTWPACTIPVRTE
jgi:hypothetical protein